MTLPHGLLLLAIACTSGVPATPTDDDAPVVEDDAPVVEDDALDWPHLPSVDDGILAIMEADHVPGLAACIVEGDRIAWCRGYGWASITDERPVRTDTPFLLASVSKAVTQTALVQAAEAGFLSLDDDVDDHLPFTVDHPAAPETAIHGRMLAAHTSGIDDNWDVLEASYTVGADSPIDLGVFLQSYLSVRGSRYDARRNFTRQGPSEVSRYTNVGAALAGQLVSEATGVPFPAWCKTHIFAPLGMTHTAWFLSELDSEVLAVPTQWRREAFQEVGHYGFPDYPSGQLRSSAVDVARFLQAVMLGGSAHGAEILSADAQAEMLRPAWPDLDPTQGLGWYRWRLDDDEVWGHNGGEVGASTEVLWWPESSRGVVVLMNAEGRANTLAAVERLLRDAPLP